MIDDEKDKFGERELKLPPPPPPHTTHTHTVPFGMEGSATAPAVISFTKSPLGKKQPRKKGFFKRVFK